jgi:hypothetical protein
MTRMPMMTPAMAPPERCNDSCFPELEVLGDVLPGVTVPVPGGELPPHVVGLAQTVKEDKTLGVKRIKCDECKRRCRFQQ